MKTVPICFVPEQTQCLTYREDSVSATLHTKYHYGSGGDAALIALVEALAVNERNPKIYDARGNGEGGVAPTITGDHNGHINDYMSVLVMALGGTDSNASVTDGTVSPCILARAGTGVGQRAHDIDGAWRKNK